MTNAIANTMSETMYKKRASVHIEARICITGVWRTPSVREVILNERVYQCMRQSWP